jgi:hypothetical protein
MPTSHWQKSSYSSSDGNTNCVEIASGDRAGRLRLRESDEPTKVLVPAGATLRGLLAHLKARDSGTP